MSTASRVQAAAQLKSIAEVLSSHPDDLGIGTCLIDAIVQDTFDLLSLYGDITVTLAPEHYDLADSLCVLWDLTNDTHIIWESVRRLSHLPERDRIDIATFVLHYIYNGQRPDVSQPVVVP